MAVKTEARPILHGLTSFEVKLITQLGLPNKIISENLGISDKAISMKLTRLALKLGVENRTAVIIKALGIGLITLDQLVYREFYDGYPFRKTN